ncbi:MAG: AbrB/MazE/SpoVT family DNA-binding domain-containing protein [Chloracidobacterium sp.]|nr:AbrB/MazE/SpoVT family DNA-binding domain-containing protein [Chloracidobacterium sp.]
MKAEAKLTSKWRITVPKQVREALGIKPGDKIIFEQIGNDIFVRRAIGRRSFTDRNLLNILM